MTWDWFIVGSGFGGSVSALRLAQKGYTVLVLEEGRRWAPEDFPRTNWNLRKWLWTPSLGFRGFFRMTFFRHLTCLSGVGVGGGSLVYANTLPTPRPSFFRAPGWAELADWEAELEPQAGQDRPQRIEVEEPCARQDHHQGGDSDPERRQAFCVKDKALASGLFEEHCFVQRLGVLRRIKR